MKYLYSANIIGQDITCHSVNSLVDLINNQFGFPILTIDKANNYFLRPHRMKKVASSLGRFQIKRQLTSSSTQCLYE